MARAGRLGLVLPKGGAAVRQQLAVHLARLRRPRLGGGGLAELQRYLLALAMARGRAVGRGAVGAVFGVIGCLHLRYVVVRARNPVALPLNQVLRYRLWFDTS